MPDRQTRNVSLPPQQEAFVQAMLAAGRYRSASEVLRDGLRLLEEAEHRRLVEQWLYEGLTDVEEARLPAEVRQGIQKHFQGLVRAALDDVAGGQVGDGALIMERLREQLQARPD